MVEIHFFNVGCGNMVLFKFPGGITYLYDCNVTEDNESRVLAYLDKAMGQRSYIDAFICSHRAADHMRGITKVHQAYPIKRIRDPDMAGTTTDSPEYREYMRLRSRVGYEPIEARTIRNIGDVVIRFMNSQDDDLADANEQSIVMKVEYKGGAAMLAGDTSFRPWKEKLLPFYSDTQLKADILLAAHHGSLSFFDDPTDERHYYTAHIKKISPAMTLISVGPNVHELPDEKALELYEKYSTGSNKGNKLYTTEEKGNMKLILEEGDWNLSVNQ